MGSKKLVNDENMRLIHSGFRVMQGSQEFVTYPANSTIRVWYSAIPDYYETHWHSAVEVLLPVEGECSMTVEDKEFIVKPGEVLIVPSGKRHSLSMAEGSSRYLVLFEMDSILILRDFSVLKTMMAMPIYIAQKSQAREQAHRLLFELVGEYYSGNLLGNMINYARLLSLYTIVGREYLSSISSQGNIPAVKQHAYWDVLDRVIDYVDRNYMTAIDLDTVSAHVGFSKFYFTRLFKQYTGTTFYHYLCQERVVKAEQLLLHTSLSVSECALQTGFNSIASFNRIYKQIRGCTPSQYRTLNAGRGAAANGG